LIAASSAATISPSAWPGATLAMIVMLLARAVRVICDGPVPSAWVTTSVSGTSPSVRDGTVIRPSSDGSVRKRSLARR
jgi:hypothetical protein